MNARVALLFNVAIMLLTFISREVWLDKLGRSLTGMSSTIADLLGFLNLAEFGVLAAISYTLYKPLFDDDKKQINDVVSVLGYMYRIIGFVVLGGGVVLSAFIPLMFDTSGVSLPLVYLSFYTFLGINLLGYFFNYKQNLLVAGYKNWVVVATTGSVNIVKVIVQILLLTRFDCGYMTWLLVEAIFGVVYTIWINVSVRKIYPWLNSSYSHGRSIRKEYREIFRKTKQVFAHKLGGFVLNQTDSIVISVIKGFTVVAEVGNYQLIFNRLTRLVFTTLDNLSAGIGNLVAEGDKPRIRSTYDQINAMFYYIGGVVLICGWLLTESFIRLWVGPEYIIDRAIFVLILLNVYIQVIRRPQDIFLSTHGIFHDVWAPWIEAILNLGISIVGGYYLGVVGVLLGTLVSTLLIAMLWKPYLLFNEAFDERVWHYWRSSLLFILLMILVGAAAQLLRDTCMPAGTWDSLWTWFARAAVLLLFVAGALGASMYAVSSGMRKFVEVVGRPVINKIFKR